MPQKKPLPMARHPKIPETICDDEVVRYLAERYRTSPQSVVRRFFEQSGGRMSDGGAESFRLEENEMAILRDMTAGSHP